MKVSLDDYDVSTPLPTDEEFYRQWRPKVAGMARNLRLLDHEMVAQDVVVDFLASGYIARWDATKGKTFDAFCWWMIRNRLYSKLRQQKRNSERCIGGWETYDTTDQLSALPGDGAYVQQEYEYIEQHVDVAKLADAISGRPGQILAALNVFAESGEEMRDQDVARALECSGTTVQMHRQTLRKVLRSSDQDVIRIS